MLKTITFAISAGIAGALFVPQVGIISPQQLGIRASIEIVIWVAVGGRGTLIGAVVGAILVNYGKSTISSANPDLWQMIMGGLFVAVVLIMPRGTVGTLMQGFHWAWVKYGMEDELPSDTRDAPSLPADWEAKYV